MCEMNIADLARVTTVLLGSERTPAVSL